MTHIPARQPVGVPTGGQFATMTKSEAEGVVLGQATPAADASPLTPRQRTNEAAQRFTELAEARTRAEEQIRRVDAATQHASVQLLSACVLERYPAATRLNLMDDTDGTGGFKAISVMDSEGLILEYGSFSKDTIFNQHVPGGAAKLSDLAQSLETEEPAWAEGIATFRSDSHRTYASIDLEAAVAASPGPRSR